VKPKPRFVVRVRAEYLFETWVRVHNVVDTHERKFVARGADKDVAERIAYLLNTYGK
jgi:hypothetical protein